MFASQYYHRRSGKRNLFSLQCVCIIGRTRDMKSFNRRRRAKKGTRAQPISHEKNRPQGAGEQSEARPHAAAPAARHIPQSLAGAGHAAARRNHRFCAGIALPPFGGQGVFIRRDRAAYVPVQRADHRHDLLVLAADDAAAVCGDRRDCGLARAGRRRFHTALFQDDAALVHRSDAHPLGEEHRLSLFEHRGDGVHRHRRCGADRADRDRPVAHKALCRPLQSGGLHAGVRAHGVLLPRGDTAAAL